jgi:peptidoglycan/LPS O-acetylase OafA/YrhL
MTTVTPQETPTSATVFHLDTSSKRVPELDGLRGLAILLVLLCHYIGNSDSSGLPNLIHLALRSLSIGWIGVDLFFVLSGFLIGGILLQSRESPRYFRTFYLRRVHRILPIYYGWILMYCVCILVLGFSDSGFYSAAANFRPVPIYVLFLQNFFYNKEHLEWVWFAVTWSLAIEEQFYLCAPLLIWRLSKRHIQAVLITVVLLSPLIRLFFYSMGPSYQVVSTVATYCRADELAIGILIAMYWGDSEARQSLIARPQILNGWLLFLSLAFCSLFYWFEYENNSWTATIGYSVLGGWFAAILLFALSRPMSLMASFLRLKPLRSLGIISYCVYIIHFPVLVAVHWLLLRDQPRINTFAGAAGTILAIVFTFGIASVSWSILEKPLIRRGHRYSY